MITQALMQFDDRETSSLHTFIYTFSKRTALLDGIAKKRGEIKIATIKNK
jgi:hypothetical protein